MLKPCAFFGGSFDPVHNAHLALAHAALREVSLDELRWIPAGHPWQKTRALTAAVHREAMVALAIEAEPNFLLDSIELRRPGPSYMIDTVRELQAVHPGALWFLIVGQDQHAGLPSWHGVEELLGRLTLAVALRPGAPASETSTGCLVRMPPTDLSSTEVRARCAAGLSIDHLVPAQVARYIDQHGLYR